jgi:hypothetical protein
MNTAVFSGSDSDDDDDDDDDDDGDDLDSSNDDVVHDVVLRAFPKRSLQSTTDSRRQPLNMDSSSSDDEYPSLSDTLSSMKRAPGLTATDTIVPRECASRPVEVAVAVAASHAEPSEASSGQGSLSWDSDSDDEDGNNRQRQSEPAISSTLVAIVPPALVASPRPSVQVHADSASITPELTTTTTLELPMTEIDVVVPVVPVVLPSFEPTEDEDLNPTPSLPLYPQV